MKFIVQKFGGTSVATAEARKSVIKKVKEAMQKGYAPVVVVSAMGRKGDPYATDTLINLLKDANISANVRELDTIMCCGEIISSAVMAATLQGAGLNAMALTGGQAGIVTDSQFGVAKIKNIDTKELIRLCEAEIIPVVCGFQGVTENNAKFTTLGRGGSDTSASAIGAALKADVIEIYTDVDGIMTADPRICENANILKQVSYNEVCNMAQQGAKVIHPRAVEIAMKSNIPLVVKSTFSDAPGTVIGQLLANEGGEVPISDKAVSGVAHLLGIAQFRVRLDPEDITAGEKVFDNLAEGGVSVGCLNLQPTLTMFAVFDNDIDKAKKVLEDSKLDYELSDNCAKVSVIGAGMSGVPGVMARFVGAFTSKNIKILQTVDSDTTISAIIDANQVKDAVNSLHSAFNL